MAKFPGGKRPEWEEKLVRTRAGDASATLHNIQLVLENHADLRGLLAMDEFANKIVLKKDPPWRGFKAGEFVEQDATEIAMWLGSPKTYGMNARTLLIIEAAEAVARRYGFNPPRQYLEGLKWDGIARVDRMLSDFFGAEPCDYSAGVSRILMLTAVARVMDPGVKVDTMVIFEGLQGGGKTRTIRMLFGPQWSAEAMESPVNKDFYQSLIGNWAVEISEMEAFSKADVKKVKQSISAIDDFYRPSYGRSPRRFKRQCVFVGTTNEHTYLRDPTGARRFLPISVASIQFDAIAAARDQLWAEAVHRYKQGETFWQLPRDAVEQQDARYEEDSWTEPVRRWLDGRGGEKDYPAGLDHKTAAQGGGIVSTTTTELLSWALHIELGKHGRPEQMRMAAIMRRLGWRNQRTWRNGTERERRWVRESAPPDESIPF